MGFNAGSIESKLTLDRSAWNRDLKEVLAQVKKLEETTITIGIEADDERFKVTTDEVKALVDELDHKTANPAINLDTGTTIEELDAIRVQVDSLDGDDIRIPVDVANASALAQLAELQAEIDLINGEDINIKADVNKSFTDLISGGAGGEGSMGLMKILILSAIALFPILSAAIGAATAEIVGFVTALVAAMGPLAILAGGIYLLYSTYKKAKKAGDQMVGPMAHFDDALNRLKDTLNKIVKAIGPAGFGLMADALDLLGQLLPPLIPMFKQTAHYVDGLVKSIGNWAKGPGYKKFIDFFGGFGLHMLKQFIKIILNLGRFFGGLFVAFEPFARIMMKQLVDLTKSWADWSNGLKKNDGFQHFIDNAIKYGPMVWKLLWSIVKAFLAFGHAMEPFAGPMIQILTDFFTYISTLSPHTLLIIIGVISALAAIFLVVVPIVGALTGAFEALGIIFGIILSPIGLILAAIVALIASFIYLYKTNADFRKNVNDTWNSIKTTVLPIIHDIVDFIIKNWPQISATAKRIFKQVEQIIVDVMAIIGQNIRITLAVIHILWSTFGSSILNLTKAAFKNVTNTVEGALNILGGIVKIFRGVFTGKWSEVWDGVKQVFRGAKQALVGLLGDIGSALVNKAGAIGSAIANAIKSGINSVIDAWNGLSFHIGGFDKGPIHIPGVTIDTPNLPHVARGGLAFRPTKAVVGDNPGPEPEVIQPLSKLQGLLDQQAPVDYNQMASSVAAALQQTLSDNGQLGGGVSAAQLEALIRAASVHVQINSQDGSAPVNDWLDELFFQFRLLGYGVGSLAS